MQPSAATTIPIVYVHLGDKPAPQLVESIVQARRVSPQNPVYVILTRNTTMAGLSEFGARIVYAEELRQTDAQRLYVSNVRKRLGKRRGFWRFTTERFFTLLAFMEDTGTSALLHLESDNDIFFDLSEAAPALGKLYKGFASTFLNDDCCVPGVFYVADAALLEEFTRYVAKRVSDEARQQTRWYLPFGRRVRMGRTLNDMIMLADFKREVAGDSFDILPMVPSDYVIDRPAAVAPANYCYSRGFAELGLVFDGATFGVYLHGLDPTDRRSPGSVGWVDERSVVDSLRFGYDGLALHAPDQPQYLSFEGRRVRLGSIHNHSKKRILS
jgi:hypothetical protein